MTFRRFPLLLAGAMLPAIASSPAPGDFAQALLLKTEQGKPIQTLLLPDVVYATSTRSDLGDLRIFNAGGTAVAHALCQQSAERNTVDSPLPVFALQKAAPAAEASADVRVRAGENVEVRVQRADEALPPPSPVLAGYVIDARQIRTAIQALRLRWHSSDGASEIRVRVQSSNDLNQWQPVVSGATLLQLQPGKQSVAAPQRVRIDLPNRKYNYLRIERIGNGPHPTISDVTGESLQPRTEPVHYWFNTAAMAAPDKAADRHDEQEPLPLYFANGRPTPATLARVPLPASNMAVHVVLESRTDITRGWVHRWQGEVHNLGEPDDSPRIQFPPTTDPLWRMRILSGAETVTDAALTLNLGLEPRAVRFLAQGDAPYSLAYGSALYADAPKACNSLIADIPADQRKAMTGIAKIASDNHGIAGGDAMLKPPEEDLPWQRILLWLVLLAGAGLLLIMSLSLANNLKRKD